MNAGCVRPNLCNAALMLSLFGLNRSYAESLASEKYGVHDVKPVNQRFIHITHTL